MIQCEQSMLIWQSAIEISGLVRAKKLSPIEVTDAVLSRIDAINPVLNAFCVVAAEQARAAAREAEIAVTKGEPLGPLHGVPVSIKDVPFTRGLTTTGGSRLFADHVPDEDAIAVARLRAAGALVLGKTNTSEFGHKAVTDRAHTGRLERWRGGRRGERLRPAGARHGRRRLDSHPRRILRRVRLQAVVRPRAGGARVP